jgi:hypothetical protein
MYDCPKSRFRMMSNHIDARSWAVPTLQNDLNAVTVSITDCYPDRLLEKLVLYQTSQLIEYPKTISFFSRYSFGKINLAEKRNQTLSLN